MRGWRSAASGPRFVGSHPLAGDHRTGPEHARADLFEGRTVVVTPTEHTRPAAVTEVSGFWQSLGANVTTMTPAKHDAALAMTSHLPHLVAVALAAATPAEFLPLTASGWRDTTRIAGGDPKLWQPIFAANREHVLDALDMMSQTLGEPARILGTRRQRNSDFHSGSGGKEETGPRCFGRLTFIRPKASPTGPPSAWPPRRANWAWPMICKSRRPADFWFRASRWTGRRSSGWRASCWSMSVVERAVIGRVGDAELAASGDEAAARARCVTVLLKPGVMDPVAQSALDGGGRFGNSAARPSRRFASIGSAARATRKSKSIGSRLLANDAIEQVYFGPLALEQLEVGRPYQFELRTVAIRELDDDALMRLSREGQLYLQLAEMQTIQQHFRELGRDRRTSNWRQSPKRGASIAATRRWPAGSRIATRTASGNSRTCSRKRSSRRRSKIRERLGDDDWCVSVFEDNAGVVRFDDQFNLAFKVETHNHPSALEPYGGANTGVGGVIRDIMGTGLGAKPIAARMCFALRRRMSERSERTGRDGTRRSLARTLLRCRRACCIRGG